MQIDLLHIEPLNDSQLHKQIICGFISASSPNTRCPNFSQKYTSVPNEVEENISALMEQLNVLGYACTKYAIMRAEHGNRITEASSKNLQPPSDGLYTTSPGTLLISPAADCANIISWKENPLTLYIIHVGWRGSVNGIVGKLQELISPKGEQAPAIITPHIRKPHFTLAGEDAEMALNYWQSEEGWREKVIQNKGDHIIYSLEDALEALSEKHNLNILYHSQLCTYTEESLHSHRRSKLLHQPEGRFASFALIVSK